MNKKIVVLSVVAVFALVGVSLTSAIGFSLRDSDEDKISPLYKVRTLKANNEADDLKANCIKDRVFLLPFLLGFTDSSINTDSARQDLMQKGTPCVFKMTVGSGYYDTGSVRQNLMQKGCVFKMTVGQ